MRPVGRNALVPLAAVVAMAAAGYFAQQRSSGRRAAGSHSTVGPGAPAANSGSGSLAPPPAAERRDAPTEIEVAVAQPYGAALDDSALVDSLRSASETVRNGTLVTAIRRAGFVCAEVRGATRFTAEMTGWRVRCAGALAYSVVPGSSGRISVEPLFEGVPPFPEPGSSVPR